MALGRDCSLTWCQVDTGEPAADNDNSLHGGTLLVQEHVQGLYSAVFKYSNVHPC